jgi:HEAT repeat protein
LARIPFLDRLMTAKEDDSKTKNEPLQMNSATMLHQLVRGTPRERAEAAENLAQQGSEAAYAASELTAACGDTEQVRLWAVAALEQLGSPPVSTIDSLIGLAQSEQPLIAYWAVTLLGRTGPKAKVHQQAIAELLERSNDLAVREKAAWSLGRMRADSSQTTRALKQAARSPEPRLSRVASKALQQMQR